MELERFGYKVMLDQSVNRFLSYDKAKWIIQVTQLQLEESFQSGYAYGYDDEDEEYYLEYRINAVALNSWLEVNRLNSNDPRQLLFLSGYIEDGTDMAVSLEYLAGQFYLTNPNYLIGFDEIYDMAEASGKKHAELLFDYFMNDYIRQNLPYGVIHRKEMHYNLKFRKIENQLIERFEVVD
jgi:hypothetical protein